MIEAGLLISGDDVPVSFDRFRDRVIFPITDFRGRIVGFGGRALAADVPAKYLNSPETELFHKGSLLYNGAEARKAAHDAGTVIAVEGYVDAIQMVGAGFAHTVAPLGTALTERQLADPLADGRRADPLLRRRRRRHPRRTPRRRPGAAAARSRARASASRFSPRARTPTTSSASAGSRGDGRRARAGAAAGRHDLDARDRGRRLRHARAPRRAGGAAPRDRPRRSTTRACGGTMSRPSRERVAAFFPAATGQRRDIGRAANTAAEGATVAARAGASAAGRRASRYRPPAHPDLRPAPAEPLIAGRAALPLREVVLVMTMLNHPGADLPPSRRVRPSRPRQSRARPAPRRAPRDRRPGEPRRRAADAQANARLRPFCRV